MRLASRKASSDMRDSINLRSSTTDRTINERQENSRNLGQATWRCLAPAGGGLQLEWCKKVSLYLSFA